MTHPPTHFRSMVVPPFAAFDLIDKMETLAYSMGALADALTPIPGRVGARAVRLAEALDIIAGHA